jgi:6-pyruvoyltetrahydropterin/6-carboxytetrahydropterin synthase
MPECALIRSVRFRAAHHYRRLDWTEARNRRVFGENVESHEHEYVLELTILGEVDAETGFLVDLAALDRAIGEIVEPLRGKDLTRAIAEVREGRMLPSTENLARWFFRQLQARIPGSARLRRIRVAESDGLAAEFPGS